MTSASYLVLMLLYLLRQADSICEDFSYEKEDGKLELRIGNIPIIQHSRQEPFMDIGVGDSSYLFHLGNFHISQSIDSRKSLQFFELIVSENSEPSAYDEGTSGKTNTLKILFFDKKENRKPQAAVSLQCGKSGNSHMRVEVYDDQHQNRYNRLWLKFATTKEEMLFGGGEQYSHFQLKGHAFPMWVREQGVSRDYNKLATHLAEWIANAGGDYHTTYWPQPTFVSSRFYYVHLNYTSYNVLNFTDDKANVIELWGDVSGVDIYFDIASSWPSLMTKLTGFLGRQPLPPKWIYDGAILGLQGGKEEVLKKYQKIKDSGTKISAIWIQDWAGKIITSLGKRVYWNWELDEDFYWQKDEMKSKLQKFKRDGVRFLSYINPHVIKDSKMYKYGDEKGFFIKNSATGGTMLVDFGEFECGSVDFTNPQAFEWYKSVLLAMVEIGFSGWMADFGGEYLPVTENMKFFDDTHSSETMHNYYSYLWAKLNRDVYEEARKHAEDIFIFMRSGYASSSEHTLMAWAGDQNVDYFLGDGLPSVIPAALSLGMSGMGLTHSDIGGYVSLLSIVRNEELLLRWAEMSVFTPVMRTHECNRPDRNWQVYTSNKTLSEFAQLTKLYQKLRPYHEHVAELNHKYGWPAQRPLFFSYPEDKDSYDVPYEYMYGPDVLVAPVFEEGDRNKAVYLPPDSWVHLWSGKTYEVAGAKGKKETVYAPLGRPPVFYRKGTKWEQLFIQVKEGNQVQFEEPQGLTWSLLRSNPLIFLYLLLRKIFYYVLCYF